jgi:hypothetical protein
MRNTGACSVTAAVFQRLIWFPFSELVVLTHTSLLDRYQNFTVFFTYVLLAVSRIRGVLVHIRIPDPFQWFCIRLRIRILIFCSVDFKMPTENKFFLKVILPVTVTVLYPQSIYISLQRLQVIKKPQN